MKYYLQIVTILLNIFIVGCSTPTAVMMKEYKGHKISGKNLTVIKLFERPTITNEDDVIDDLGTGIPDEVYISFFNKNIIKAFGKSNCCNKVNYIEKISVSDMEQKVLDINDQEKMKIFIPKENRKIEIDSISSDFILFLDNLQISRLQGSSGMWIGGTYSGGSFNKLYHQISFVLWDNINGKIVSYGRVSDESTVVFAMTKHNWESILEGLASKILDYSPFPGKYSVNY